jgi:DNA-binding NarL/FixJ family response regulator
MHPFLNAISGLDSSLRVLIVSDDSLTRAGLGNILERHERLSIVAQIDSTELTEETLSIYLPEIILWDLGWKSGEAQEIDPSVAWEEIDEIGERFPLVALLADKEQVQEAYLAGARGILSRDLNGTALANALLAVAEGLRVIDPELEARLFPSIERLNEESYEDLTSREMEVLKLLAEGFPNKTIALNLDVSEHTIKFHVHSIFRKLNAQSRTDAVVRATRLGLLML